MESRNSEMPCKIRKRRFPTASSSSFTNDNISQLLVGKTPSHSPGNEKCFNMLDRSNCKEQELEADHNRVNKVIIDKSITNVDRSRNKSRTSSGRLPAPEVINPRYKNPCSFVEKDKSFGGMHSIIDATLFEGKSRAFGQVEIETNNHNKRSMLKPTHDLNEIKQSLTISRELLKLLTHVWTVDTNHSMSLSLASTLNHELNKARSHVNKLIQEQRSHNTTSCESKHQDKVRFAVRTIARELEIEKKLRRQTERMNKKLGRELANTKSCLSKAIEKAETEKQATEILEQLCEKMAHKMEQDRADLQELKKESERVREEMEEEREMLRVADILREERVHMKLLDAKYEYEDRHAQVNMIARDLEELLEVDNNTDHLKKIPKVLSWYESRVKDNGEDENTTRDETRSYEYENKKHEGANDENALGENLLNKGEVVNDENSPGEKSRGGVSWCEEDMEQVEIYRSNMIGFGEESRSRVDEVIDCCIELEFGKNESEELNEEEVSNSYPYDMKEYEDEMERYKMIKDLRDRIVSAGSDLSRDTIEFGSYT